MRVAFHKELDVLAQQLADLAVLKRVAMTDATTALLDNELTTVEQVEATVDEIRIASRDTDAALERTPSPSPY